MSSVLYCFLLIGNFLLIPIEAVVEEYLKPTVNPCDDFHQYACGKWSEINSNVEHGDTLSLLDAAINRKVSNLLESDKEHGIMDKVKIFYDSCRKLEGYDMNLFLNFVKPQSDWTVSSSWDASKFSWIHTIAELRRYGVNVFLEQTIMPRWDNSSVYAIYLDKVKFKPTNEETINSLLHKAALNNSLAEELAIFEKQLAEILPSADTSVELDDVEEVVLGYVQETAPKINWEKYFSIVFGHEIDLYTPMIVEHLDIMSKLADFLDKSQPHVVCNYIMIKFLQFLDEYSIDNVSSNECTTTLHQAMPLAVDHIIENHFYEHEYDQVVQDLFNYLKVEFLAEVSKVYENQRDVLLFIYTKTSVMDIQIGNSDRNLTSEAISKYYESLHTKEGNFYFNLLEAFKFKTTKDFNMLKGEPVNIAHQWTVTPSPFFLQSKNRVIVPLTLLQDRIFPTNTSSKYSVLGFIIGHEFLHGFDLNGVNYDYTGALVESALSCNPTFRERILCIQELLGDQGLGEKIADFGGIRLAYEAYQRSLIQIGKNIMDNEGTVRPLGQSFFIEYAQFFCGNSQKLPKRFADVHDADEARIKGSLMNFNTFANAFECPVGSAINPEKKCRVW